jgi:hypothetical protein
MTQNPTQVAIERALRGLKDFQTATANIVHDSLFVRDQKCMLVADEVGLGKTIVAKGVIAKELTRRRESGVRRPLKVTYICSNQVIAGENVSKLNIFPSADVVERVNKRIAFLAYDPPGKGSEYRKSLVLNTLTPGTSFSVSKSPGVQGERKIIYSLLCNNEQMQACKAGLSCLLRGGVSRDIDAWRADLEAHRECVLRPDLSSRYVKALKTTALPSKCRHTRNALGIEGPISVFDATLRLGRFLRVSNEWNHRDASHEMILQLRPILIEECLHYLDADLYILDEFQRFRSLIDTQSDDEASATARRVFKRKKARVLLLSATPFKAFTGDVDEENGEDHYKDFRVVLKFLTEHDPALLERYDAHRTALYRQLLGLNREQLDLSTSHKEAVEGVLRQIMCRTERNIVSSDPAAMIKDAWRERTPTLTEYDIHNFVATDQIAKALAEADDRKGRSVGKPVEYCKSSPFPLSFLDGYQLKSVLSQFKGVRDLRRALRKLRSAWLDIDAVDNYRLQMGASNGSAKAPVCEHARISQLVDVGIGSRGAELLWVPPSLPYYPLGGPFGDVDNFSKTLVFSAWVMVPRMIGTLVSYEVERRTVGDSRSRDRRETVERSYFPPSGKLNHRRHPVPLLTFSRSSQANQRVALNMSNLCLLYPSPTLAEVVQQQLRSTGKPLESIRDAVAAALRKMIMESGITRYGDRTGEPDKWYWAAPVLLDRQQDSIRDAMENWLSDSDFRESDFFNSGQDEKRKVDAAKLQHLDELREAFLEPGQIGLGEIPDDLPEILADMAIGSPSIAAFRSIGTVFDDPLQSLGEAFEIAGEFLNLFNKPESISAIRLSAEHGHYWQQVLRYCGQGCIHAMLDEYLHLLRGQHRSRSEAIQALRETININASSINVDGVDSFLKGSAAKMRCHYAVDFGNQRIETDGGQKRAANIRANFNAPFRPFVLATTSIGQEGLDFHHYCRRIMHWNLPGNPIDLEQREGRINRYKGLVVRQQLAKRYGEEALAQSPADTDPWDAVFDAADRRERISAKKCELVPFWHVDNTDVKIERVVPMYPFSRDQERLERILKTLAIYRLAFGQPRQVELVDHLLAKDFSPDEIQKICQQLMINLSPITYAADTSNDLKDD